MRPSGPIAAALLFAVCLLACCEASEMPGTQSLRSAAGPYPGATPASIVADHAEMAAVVAESLSGPWYFHDGTWHLHFGDANMYGPSYDLATWTLTGDEFNRERGLAALEWDLGLVESATRDVRGLIDAFSDLEAVSMALTGILEAGLYVQDERYPDAAEPLIDVFDRLASLFDDYLPSWLGEFAGSTYGPTAISSLIALVHLEAAMTGPQADAAAHLARAQEALDNIHAAAWSDALGAYRFAPDDDRLMLYPNVTMMLALGRAWELTGDPLYAQRIAAVYEGIQRLRAESGDHYYSPYSREEAGAHDVDYATLSSQNYLMLGLWLGWHATGDRRYLDDIDLVLGWIETHLLVDGVIKHHWIDGRVADERDLYEFCAGCNLQTLYILRVIELEVAAGE